MTRYVIFTLLRNNARLKIDSEKITAWHVSQKGGISILCEDGLVFNVAESLEEVDRILEDKEAEIS